MLKRFSILELLVLTGAIALWINWFRMPPVELAGCFKSRPITAVQHIDEYRIHGEEAFRRWFRRTISDSIVAPFPGYAYSVINERSDLLVIPVASCTAKYEPPASFQARNRLNGSVVFVRHDYVEASTAAQRLVVPSNATVVRGTLAFAIVADVLIVAFPVILVLVLRRNQRQRLKTKISNDKPMSRSSVPQETPFKGE